MYRLPPVGWTAQYVVWELQLCDPSVHGWKVGLADGWLVGAAVGTAVGEVVGAIVHGV